MLQFRKNYLIIFIASILFAGVFLIVQSVDAAPPWQLVPECGKGGCNVCDAIGVGITITRVMLGTLGSAALLVFVYGGVLMATSRGHTDQVQHGKDALINAVKGVIIVLSSWIMINYGLATLLNKPIGAVTIFDQKWVEVTCTPSKVASSAGSSSTTSNICEGRPSGYSCGSGLACDGNGQCLIKCEAVHSSYRCQDTSKRSDGKSGCEKNLCAGSPSFMCCPVSSSSSNVCEGKSSGDSCGNGLACDGKGQCLTKCEVVYNGYRCQDITKRKKGNTDCGSDLCTGSADIKCCPVP